MAVTVLGVQLVNLTLTKNKEEGTIKLTGNYELMSSAGKVLAKQGFNSYSEVALTQSGETMKLISELQASIQKDLNTTLGLE